MATGNRKTSGKQSAEERRSQELQEYVRQTETGEAAAMAYLEFLPENDHCGGLQDIAFDMLGWPRSASLRVQGAAFFSVLDGILRQVAPLLNIKQNDDQILSEFVRGFKLNGPRKAADLKDLRERGLRADRDETCQHPRPGAPKKSARGLSDTQRGARSLPRRHAGR